MIFRSKSEITVENVISLLFNSCIHKEREYVSDVAFRYKCSKCGFITHKEDEELQLLEKSLNGEILGNSHIASLLAFLGNYGELVLNTIDQSSGKTTCVFTYKDAKIYGGSGNFAYQVCFLSLTLYDLLLEEGIKPRRKVD